MRDYPHWVKLRRDNQKYLQMREPLWMPDELSRRSFRLRLRTYNQEARQDRGYAFFIWNLEMNQMMGAVNLSYIRAARRRWARSAIGLESVSPIRG